MAVMHYILIFVVIALVASAILLEFVPNNKLAILLKRKLRLPISSLGGLNRRKLIDIDELSLIEKDIGGLQSVVLISARAEAPTDSALAPAVIDNFREGVNYRFFVSAKEKENEANIKQLYSAFRALFSFALETAPQEGRHSRIRTRNFDELFSVSYLPIEWRNVPYLFYTFNGDGQKPRTLAFKGTQKGVGISDEYFRVSPTESRAIIELCASASEDFRPAIGVEDVTIGTELPDDKVLRFDDELKRRNKA